MVLYELGYAPKSTSRWIHVLQWKADQSEVEVFDFAVLPSDSRDLRNVSVAASVAEVLIIR